MFVLAFAMFDGDRTLRFERKILASQCQRHPFPLDDSHDTVIFERVGRFQFFFAESLIFDKSLGRLPAWGLRFNKIVVPQYQELFLCAQCLTPSASPSFRRCDIYTSSQLFTVRDDAWCVVLLKRHSSIVRLPGWYVQARSAIPSSTLSSQVPVTAVCTRTS